MRPDLQRWLKRKLVVEATANGTTAVLALIGSLVILFLTFWFAYAVVYIGEQGLSALTDLIGNRRIRFGHVWRLVISGAFMLVLIIERARRSSWETGNCEWTKETPVALQAPLRLYGGALGQLLARPRASSHLIADLLYSGPTLLLGSYRLAKDAMSLARLDSVAAIRALSLLACHDGAVTPEQFMTACPESDWEQTCRDLRHIQGVVFLKAGLSLTEELRSEVRGIQAQ